jgi:glutathione S-transferase
MTTLHQLRRCPWAAAVRQALDNVGRDYGVIQVPYERELRAEVRQLTGQDLTPVLVDGNRIIAESHRIVAYLYGTYGDERQRVRAEELLRLVEELPAICAVGS